MSKIDKIIERGGGCVTGSDLTPMRSPKLDQLRDFIDCINRRCWGCPCNLPFTIKIICTVEQSNVQIRSDL